MSTMAFKEGDIVRVKQGVLDPDFGDDIGDWQGKIADVDDGVVCIDLDNITLSKCPDEYIQQAEEDGLDWEQIYLSIEDIEPAIPRITPVNLTNIKEVLHFKHRWDHLGEFVRERIHEVLKDTNITDEDEVMAVWGEYLSEKLTFPFDAEISEYQDKGPLQQGDKIRIHEIIGSDHLYGVLVKLRLSRKGYHSPLCIVTVEDKHSKNYQIVNAYNIWFANR